MKTMRMLLLKGMHYAAVLLLSPLSRIWHKDESLWVFGTNTGQFVGNPKYLYLWLLIHRPDLRPMWVTQDTRSIRELKRHGLPVVRRWSLRGAAITLNGGVALYSVGAADVNAALTAGSVRVNLWHGVGLKSLPRPCEGLAAPRGTFGAILRIIEKAKALLRTPPNIFVTTTPFMHAHFVRQLDLPESIVKCLGYPRLDFTLDDQLLEKSRLVQVDRHFSLNPEGRYDRVYLYAPTFRDTGRPFIKTAIKDLNALQDALASTNALLYIKPHPNTRDLIPSAPNVRAWPVGVDCQTYLPEVSTLITDYSSIVFDYIALSQNMPILYRFDEDEYSRDSRELTLNADDHCIGITVTSFEELCSVLAAGGPLIVPEPLSAKRMKVLREFWGSRDVTPSCARIVAAIETAQRTGLSR